MEAAPDLALPFDPVPVDWLGRADRPPVAAARKPGPGLPFLSTRTRSPGATCSASPAPGLCRCSCCPAAEWDRRLAAVLERGGRTTPWRPSGRCCGGGLLAADLQEAGSPFRFDARNTRVGLAGATTAGLEPPPARRELLTCVLFLVPRAGFLTAPAAAGEEIVVEDQVLRPRLLPPRRRGPDGRHRPLRAQGVLVRSDRRAGGPGPDELGHRPVPLRPEPRAGQPQGGQRARPSRRGGAGSTASPSAPFPAASAFSCSC